jgi:ATP-dependent helicase/nuclease subunit A
MSFSPRPIQEEIIRSDESHLVVVAGAGAGKTSVLVQRYLRFVRDHGISPDRMLCITFTRKAAAQMKQKIVAALREEGLAAEAQAAEIGPVQTIHSFCERLLRENALTSGLDPEFELLSEAASAMLVRRSIESALADPPDGEGVNALLHGLAGQGASTRGGRRRNVPHARLEDVLQSFLDKVRPSGLTRDTLMDRYRSPEATITFWREAVRLKVEHDLPTQVPDPFQSGLISTLYKEHKVRRPNWHNSVVTSEALREEAEMTCGLVGLGCEAWRLLEVEMHRRQVLDFTELEARAVRLVERSENVRERARAGFQVMMVDEAQDLNPLQSRLLSGLGIGTRMYVGDPFQSIYGWRMADYELFRSLATQGPRRDLNENHRSDAGVLNFVQHVFSQEWSDDAAYNPMVKPGQVRPDIFDDPEPRNWSGVRVWRQSQKNVGAVALKIKDLRAELGNKAGIAVLVRSTAYGNELYRRLQAIHQPARLVGGTDRYYTRLEVRDVANCLRALASPYDNFALLATLRSPFAEISLDSIALLALQKPVVEALADFNPPVPEDRAKIERFLAWFTPLSNWADRVPAWEVLSEVFAVSGYWEAIAGRPKGRQALANVRKLLTLAGEVPDEDAGAFAERIREIQQMNHREGDAAAEAENEGEVSILTIHKAKGLQWDVVVVPDLHTAVGAKKEDLEFDARSGFVSTGFTGPPEVMPHAFARDLRGKREEGEASRLLYVALTRAAHELCIVADPRAKDGSPAKKLAARMGLTKEPMDGIRDEVAE